MQAILNNEKFDNSQFYKANTEWLNTGNKASWNIMWQQANAACLSRMKIFSKKVPRMYNLEKLEELALDAAILVMKSIKRNNTSVKNLSNFVYLFCYGVMYNKKKREMERRETNLEEGLLYENQ